MASEIKLRLLCEQISDDESGLFVKFIFMLSVLVTKLRLVKQCLLVYTTAQHSNINPHGPLFCMFFRNGW